MELELRRRPGFQFRANSLASRAHRTEELRPRLTAGSLATEGLAREAFCGSTQLVSLLACQLPRSPPIPQRQPRTCQRGVLRHPLRLDLASHLLHGRSIEAHQLAAGA